MTECDPAHLYAAWYQNSELSSCHEDMCMTAVLWHISPSYLILVLVLDSPILEGKASHHLHLGTPALWLMSAESIICEIPGTEYNTQLACQKSQAGKNWYEDFLIKLPGRIE